MGRDVYKKIHILGFIIISVFMLLICFQGIVLAGLEGNSRFDDLKSGKLPVTIYAKQLEHRRAENLFIGEGFVDIRYGNVRLQADKVEFNTETGQVVAVGNVILDEGANRITGDRMEININTKLGLIYNGAGSLESGYFFTGKKIDRVAEDDFLIEEGTYTSCNQPLPDWRFKAEKTRLHIEHYAYLHNFTMRLRDIPILYAPYGVFPIKTKRSSGFLTPKIGQSNRNGFMFKNQYFWAINDWSDATFGVDYYSTRGIGESLEGRYALTDKSKGQVNAYHINDEIMAKERWQAKIGLKQELPHEVFGVFWLDASSDNQFDRQLANDIVTRSRQEQESYFSFSKNWDGYNLNFWGNYFKSLYQTNKAVYQRMPELQFNSVSQRMGTSPVFYEWESSVSELAKDSNQGDGFHMQRANLHPRLSLPWKLHDGMVLTPSAGVWNTWYSESKNGDALTRNMYDLKLQFDGPQAYRVFNVEEGEDLQALKHVVYPNITYSYIPYKDQKDVFQFDNLDQVNQAYKLDYSIINHLLGKYKSVDGREPQVRDLLTVSLSQSFNLAEERRMVNLDKSPRRPFSDFKLDVEVKPTPALRFDTETYVNVYDDYLDRVNTDVWIDPPGKIWALTSGWRYARKTPARPNGNEFLRLGGKLKLGSWRFDTSMYYNLQDEGRIEMRYRLEYFSQCWSVALIHISRPYEDEFNFTFGLMGLGSTSSN